MLLLDNGIRTTLSVSGNHFSEAEFMASSLEEQSKTKEQIVIIYLDRHHETN